MMPILHPQVEAQARFLLYRYRFLLNYILIGITSLIIEFAILRILIATGAGLFFAVTTAVGTAIVFAYWMNVRFNFCVPKPKRSRAFRLFVAISLCSLGVNWLLKSHLERIGLNYESSRTLAAGTLFLIAYFFHRKYSFSDFKQVGVAIYANGIEDIRAIKDSVGDFPNFIHVDIIDTTFGQLDLPPAVYRLESIRAHWPDKKIHVHLMSKAPSTWIDETAGYVDVIFIHHEIDDNLIDCLRRIRKHRLKAGLCFLASTDPSDVRPYVDEFDYLMVLAVERPGRSGQCFQEQSLRVISSINSWPERSKFILCVDGGVNERNIGLLNAESVVSGSSVLNHATPKRQILRLQTSSTYETV